MKAETGKLDEKPLAYLTGGIESSASDWRADVTTHLYNLGYNIYDPAVESLRLIPVSVHKLNDLKYCDMKAYKVLCDKIVLHDFQAIRKCSLVISKIDSSSASCLTTIGQLSIARKLGKPIFAWITLGGQLTSLPVWVVGCINYYSSFQSDFYKSIPTASELRTSQSLLTGFSL